MTRDQFAEVVTRLAMCREGPKWARGFTPYEAWHLCHRPDWMLFLVLSLAYLGGGGAREWQWHRYFRAMWGGLTVGWQASASSPNPTPTEIRRAVPWPMVRDALEREAREMGVIR